MPVSTRQMLISAPAVLVCAISSVPKKETCSPLGGGCSEPRPPFLSRFTSNSCHPPRSAEVTGGELTPKRAILYISCKDQVQIQFRGAFLALLFILNWRIVLFLAVNFVFL